MRERYSTQDRIYISHLLKILVEEGGSKQRPPFFFFLTWRAPEPTLNSADCDWFGRKPSSRMLPFLRLEILEVLSLSCLIDQKELFSSFPIFWALSIHQTYNLRSFKTEKCFEKFEKTSKKLWKTCKRDKHLKTCKSNKKNLSGPLKTCKTALNLESENTGVSGRKASSLIFWIFGCNLLLIPLALVGIVGNHFPVPLRLLIGISLLTQLLPCWNFLLFPLPP